MKITYVNIIFVLSVVLATIVISADVISISKVFDEIVGINDKVKQLDFSSQERERMMSLKDSIASTKLERGTLNGFFVGASNAAVVDFTKSLENLALENGVTQRKTLNYEPLSGLESSSMLSSIRFRLTVSGNWTNVYTFLQAIENLPKVMSLNSVALSANLANPSAGDSLVRGQSWTADLDFSVAKLTN